MLKQLDTPRYGTAACRSFHLKTSFATAGVTKKGKTILLGGNYGPERAPQWRSAVLPFLALSFEGAIGMTREPSQFHGTRPMSLLAHTASHLERVLPRGTRIRATGVCSVGSRGSPARAGVQRIPPSVNPLPGQDEALVIQADHAGAERSEHGEGAVQIQV